MTEQRQLILSKDVETHLMIRGLSRKYSAILKVLENWSHGLDVTWQPVRGDLTALA
jgi:hypothetical protein